jgi:hypothetical protein
MYTIVIFYKQCTWGCSGTSPAAPFRRGGSGTSGHGMGGWLSRGGGDAAPPDTPAPVKLTGPDAAQRSAQLVTQLQGARHAPASRALPRVVGSRRTTCARPARHLGFGGVPPLSPRRREGSVCAACSEGRSLGRSPGWAGVERCHAHTAAWRPGRRLRPLIPPMAARARRLGRAWRGQTVSSPRALGELRWPLPLLTPCLPARRCSVAVVYAVVAGAGAHGAQAGCRRVAADAGRGRWRRAAADDDCSDGRGGRGRRRRRRRLVHGGGVLLYLRPEATRRCDSGQGTDHTIGALPLVHRVAPSSCAQRCVEALEPKGLFALHPAAPAPCVALYAHLSRCVVLAGWHRGGASSGPPGRAERAMMCAR